MVTPMGFHILLALADEPRHGLGIVDEVEERTGGELKLGPGTLYTTIRKLVESGLIAEPAVRPDRDDDDPRRRYYTITESGRQALAQEAARLERLVGVARAKQVLRST